MPYNFVADALTVFAQRSLLQTFFKCSAILDGKRPFCVFSPLLWGLRDNVRC